MIDLPEDINKKKKVFQLFLEAAESNHLESQNEVGIAYDTGFGSDINEGLAREWFLKAASAGNHNALINLHNTRPPTNELSELLKNCAQREDIRCMRSLIIDEIEDKPVSLYWARKIAKLRDPEGMVALAEILLIPNDSESNREAIEWLQRVLELDNNEYHKGLAHFLLGQSYMTGRGVALDKAISQSHFSKAASFLVLAETPSSNDYLAQMYLNGWGVPQNIKYGKQLQAKIREFSVTYQREASLKVRKH